MTVATRIPCGPFCTSACRAADAELHGARSFYLPEDRQAMLDQRLANQLDEDRRQRTALDITEDEPEWAAAVERELRTTRSGNQGDHDIAAVQLRPEHFSPAMVEKAGRLYHAGWKAHGPNDFEVASESGDEWYLLRVWETTSGVWFATCNCAARPGRWNRAGACAHRALAGYLRAEQTGQPIPRWQDLNLAEVAS